jgi:hypothetical protein
MSKRSFLEKLVRPAVILETPDSRTNLSWCLGYIPIFAYLIDAAPSQLVVAPTGPM